MLDVEFAISGFVDRFHTLCFTYTGLPATRLLTLYSSRSTGPQRQMEEGASSTSSPRHNLASTINNTPDLVGLQVLLHSSTSTALQRQVEVGESSISTVLQRQTNVRESSTSTAREDNRESENPFHGITPKPSASSSAVMKKGPWDVFINHRGCDTKHTLASTIYHTLDLIRFNAFLDVEELDLGDSIPEEIEEAMRTAGLHIAIFSKNYAESPWCLAELCYMLKTGTPILPVFYHVDPSDLRWVAQEKGLYAPAFSDHKKKGRYPSSKLDEWETALERVSNLSGHVFNENNGDEGMLLKSIVNSVLKVIRMEPLEVAKHPVGMDEIVEGFEKSRQEHIEKDQQVQIVGIVGLGGSGKTTLATELYNRESSSFNSSSFLHDIRDAASKNALHTKQKKLLEDLRIQAYSFDNVREGKRILSQNLPSLRALVVLDDVDHEDQLDALLPAKERLGSGSLVIVTTREGDVLVKWGITSTYKMQSVHRPLAKQLFCWHAFLKPSPQEGFEDLVEKFIDVCHGLPLSLKVIGGQLYGKRSTAYWVSQLDKIHRILPKEVMERLKVSYDALDEDEKQVFLDIACFFIGERPRLAIAVWDESGWSGLCSWESLHNKCLVEVVDEYEGERIRMHDHLRDLGREIAKTHSPSRIWSKRQSMHFQEEMWIQGTISTALYSWGRYISPPFNEIMEIMRTSNVRIGLQVLIEGNDDFTRECWEPMRGLLWFRRPSFQEEHRCIPSWLSLDNIRVQELKDPFKLETLRDDGHAPLQLRELPLKIDNTSLQELPASIGQLSKLEELKIYQCPLLTRLPTSLGSLSSLVSLSIEGCLKLYEIPSLAGLVSLKTLRVIDCPEIKKIEGLEQLTSLEELVVICMDMLDGT